MLCSSEEYEKILKDKDLIYFDLISFSARSVIVPGQSKTGNSAEKLNTAKWRTCKTFAVLFTSINIINEVNF